MERINVMRPYLGREEAEAAMAAIESGWVAQGPRVADFERAFAELVQAEHAVAVSSCTAALHLALVAVGVEAGDEVIVPSFSFIATANAPTYLGATPVMVDVDAKTGNITPETVAPAITGRTRAIIAVDQGGVPLDLAPLRALADEHGLALVEDAACAAGSTYDGAPVGSGADATAWSFHPRKLLTTGEGGMVTTDDPERAARVRRLREHAMDVSAADRHQSVLAPAEQYLEIGFNYRMTDIQAAVGIVQLERLPGVVQRRRELVARYRAAIADVPGLRLVEDPPWGTTNYQSAWVEVGEGYPTDREGLLAALAAHGISARRGIMAAHRQPAYAHLGLDDAALPATAALTDSTLILPLYHQLQESDVDRVAAVLREPGATP